jgi:hypothetical protein
MFCPKCAVENHDQTRFCRGCGADLEVVALALNAQLTLPAELGRNDESKTELTQQRIKLQVDGIQHVLRGGLIFATGIFLGIPWLCSVKTLTGTQTDPYLVIHVRLASCLGATSGDRLEQLDSGKDDATTDR